MSRISAREEAPFTDALALPEVQSACLGDSAVRERVEALLDAHEGPASLLETPVAAYCSVVPEEKPGDAIGRY